MQELDERIEQDRKRDLARLLADLTAMTPRRFREICDPIHSAALRDFRYEEGRGAYITGRVGAGKTVLSFFLAREMIKRGLVHRSGIYGNDSRPILRVSAVEMVIDFQNFDKGHDLSERLATYKFRNLLMIDDFGTEKLTDFVYQCIYEVLNKRYEQMLPTIITSNKNLQDLDERIASRISEACDVIALSGGDLRLKGVVGR